MMAYSPSASAVTKKLIENLQTDLRSLSSECKRKYPPVKEASEAGLLKIRNVTTKSNQDIIAGLLAYSVDIVHPFILGCNTKSQKIVLQSLMSIQRLIQHQALSLAAAHNVINTLWALMEQGMEELKLLQTAILLITTNSVVQHQALAKALVLCFRLHFTKDSTTINTAAATVRQLVYAVFERVLIEDAIPSLTGTQPSVTRDTLIAAKKEPPPSLKPAAADAFMLFQDFCHLVNAEQPTWLNGMTEMTRTFGLELIESVLTDFPQVFIRHEEFSFLVKERVCPLVIKLFSPSLKYKVGMPNTQAPSVMDKPYFPIVMRLLRMVAVLIRNYYELLVTECEIFLSLLVKFLDPEKPGWQRAVALEVLCKLCSQPILIKNFCISYDMKPHSTKIFQDIVNGLGAFIQSQFVNQQATHTSQQGTKPPDIQGTPPALVGGMPVGGGVTPQAAFCYRSVWIPLVINPSQNTQKTTFLDMLDKQEPPSLPDGYGLSVSFLCMLDVVKCVQGIIEEPALKSGGSVAKVSVNASGTNGSAVTEEGIAPSVSVEQQLINSSWCGVLAALTLLLDASTDESATEAILKALQTCANLCGQLRMHTPRDAFITALCKSSLPPHYSLTVLNPTGTHHGTHHRVPSHGRSTETVGSENGDQSIQGSQVVAVGTPLPTASMPLGVQQGSVMLTAKNIQCMRAILNMAHCHGSMLETAWHQVLTTLQHLSWILGLKPSTGGSLKAGQHASDNPNAVITTAVMADLPVLAAMLSRLFESSQYLDDVALHHLIDALCQLCTEAMELAYSNREPSLFAVAKLLETGLVNLTRVEVLWRPVLAQLLEVCQHPYQGMRIWGAEAVTSLVNAALSHEYEHPLHQQQKLQAMLLGPLHDLSGIMHADIRQKQLDCVMHVLHNNGDCLAQGWPLVLGVIGALKPEHSENLIRMAFQCLQFVAADFLPTMPCACLQVVVEVSARFGLQKQELNVSLTAVGLLWNISDYFYQNRIKISQTLNKEAESTSHETQSGEQSSTNKTPFTPLVPFDSLWMCVFLHLGDLCVDQRPAVRKSSGQTLFSTITAHGSLLQKSTWQTVLWQVLFPLLEKVKKHSSEAPDCKEEHPKQTGNILIHHSRDTAQKQWAETQVLALAGVARVFSSKKKVMQNLGDFPKAWALLLEFIESSALCKSAEVSLASLKSFQEMLEIKSDSADFRDEWKLLFESPRSPSVISAPTEEKINRLSHEEQSRQNKSESETKTGKKKKNNSRKETAAAESGVGEGHSEMVMDDDLHIWSQAWEVWLNIGTAVTMPPDSSSSVNNAAIYVPSQPFLTALIKIFPPLYDHIKGGFQSKDLNKLCLVLQQALAVPVHSDSSPFVLVAGDVALTPLHEAILNSIKVLQKDLLVKMESMASMYPDLFRHQLQFVDYAVCPPKFGKVETKPLSSARGKQADWVAMNYVPFSEGVLKLVVDLYIATGSHSAVIQAHVAEHIIKTFHTPLALKYGCPSYLTWKLVIESLLVVLNKALPIAHLHKADFQGMWTELGNTLEDFLFSKSAPPPELSIEEFQRDEATDCKVIQLIRDDILPHSKNVPNEFVVKMMDVLNRGSIHSATSDNFIDTESSKKLREEFAKLCFETLLQSSFITSEIGVSEKGSLTTLAVKSLLHRCKDVLKKYVQDEKMSGKCPLPRPRMSEMAFVLKAVSTLLVTLKRAPPTNVDMSMWRQVIDLYPALVECTTSTSSQVCSALREALIEYQDLIGPPRSQAAK